MDYSILPSVNAALNASSFLLLILGYIFIRRRAITAHKAAMLAACSTSALFLISYLTYHFHHGSTRFQSAGPVRWLYFAILLSHTILAVVVFPMAIMTLVRGLQNKLEKHVWIARRTLPIWIYVSITGVIVYWMLYHLYD